MRFPVDGVIHRAASQSATPTSRLSSRGSTPAVAAIATRPAETKPPTLQPPCSDDMIGFGSWRSRATPCAFIATSIAPLLAPNTNRIAPSMYGLVASSGSGSMRQKTSVATRVTEALERPSRMWPVSGIETSAPAAMHSRHRPIVDFETPR